MAGPLSPFFFFTRPRPPGVSGGALPAKRASRALPPPAAPARHNAAYWHGEKYLGIGPAAHSFDGRERHWNVASVARYIAGEEAEAERLTEHDRFNEYLLTRLRTAEGICLEELRQRFGAERAERLRREAARWIAAGTLRISSGRMAVSPEHFLVSDAVIESLFEA